MDDVSFAFFKKRRSSPNSGACIPRRSGSLAKRAASATVPSRATIPKQLDGHCRKGQQERKQDYRNGSHAPIIAVTLPPDQ